MKQFSILLLTSFLFGQGQYKFRTMRPRKFKLYDIIDLTNLLQAMIEQDREIDEEEDCMDGLYDEQEMTEDEYRLGKSDVKDAYG